MLLLSQIFQFSNILLYLISFLEVVVTTIAAQINPPFKLSQSGLLKSTVSTVEINGFTDDVFKPRHLNEEDFQDGRVTLPIVKGQLMRHTPPPSLDDSPPTTPPTPPPEHHHTPASAPTWEFGGMN